MLHFNAAGMIIGRIFPLLTIIMAEREFDAFDLDVYPPKLTKPLCNNP